MSEALLFVGVLALASALILAALGAALTLTGPTGPPQVAATPQPIPQRESTRRTRLRLRCRVLFVQPHARSMTLDCVLDEASDGASFEAGVPFRIAVAPPDTVWFSDRVEELLAQWAAENRVLDLTVLEHAGEGGKPHAEVSLSSGDSLLQLELRAAAGIEPALP